jgi:hypothetical protein
MVAVAQVVEAVEEQEQVVQAEQEELAAVDTSR